MSTILTPCLSNKVNAGKRRKTDATKWTANEPKQKRDSGEAHISRRGKENDAKQPPVDVIDKSVLLMDQNYLVLICLNRLQFAEETAISLDVH
jgi:hypothetical protein